MRVAVFDLTTGEILRVIDAPSHIAQSQAQPGEGWVACAEDTNDLIHWINPVSYLRENRPAMPGTLDKDIILADGQDVATLSNLPGCALTINGIPYEVTDGSFQITSNIPKTFRIEVEVFPYLPASFTVEAV